MTHCPPPFEERHSQQNQCIEKQPHTPISCGPLPRPRMERLWQELSRICHNRGRQITETLDESRRNDSPSRGLFVWHCSGSQTASNVSSQWSGPAPVGCPKISRSAERCVGSTAET